MLTLKNPFAAKHPTTPPELPVPSETVSVEDAVFSSDAATAVVKAGKQLFRWRAEHGRTRALVKRLTAELERADIALAGSRRALGERECDGLDVNMEETKHVGDRVRVLREAFIVAQEKDVAAHAALKHAELQMSIEAEVAALAHCKKVGLRVDDLFKALHGLAEEQAEAWDNVRLAGGNEKYASRQIDARLQFGLFIGIAAHPMTGVGQVPTRLMKFQKYSECAPDPDESRTRRRA